MKDDRPQRVQNMLDAIEDYAQSNGGKYVLYMLTDEDPLPAPQLKDTTLRTEKCMVIIPDTHVDKETVMW